VQVEPAVALSVAVRSAPVTTVVNGMPMARLARMTLVHRVAVGSNLDYRVRPVLGD
jgi:hypothetical protein